MPAPARERIIVGCLLVIAAATFLVGINWGLPSRKVDPFLFGDRTPWTGAQIVQLAGDRSNAAQLGADVDRNPIARTSAAPVALNETDQQRAEIVRRYRLYTYQPDEMITMMALASMRPSARDFDPKLYQYGGLWIYPVGGLIKVCAQPRADQTYYLDHPEAFGRFYIIARLYVVLWAIIGAAAVYATVRRRSGDSLLAPICATLAYSFLPVVVNMAHEAKPHLPAAVLTLLAMLAAVQYVESGKKRWWFFTAVLCGAAMGMVLSAVTALAILPVMALLRRGDKSFDRFVVLLASLIVAIDVYFATNPYVLVHLLHDRAALMSNLANSRAMYTASPSWSGVTNAVQLVAMGATFPILLIGIVAACAFAIIVKKVRGSLDPMVWFFLVMTVIGLIGFALPSTNKPAEYARFALLPDIILAVVATIGLCNVPRFRIARTALPIVLVAYTFLYAFSYDWHFARDSIARTPRMIVAERLRDSSSLALLAEPAPYSMPPVDLFRTRLTLVDRPGDATIYTVDFATKDDWSRPRLFATPISWAGKPFRVRSR